MQCAMVRGKIGIDMKYIVTWRPTCAEESYLTILDADLDPTVSEIMEAAMVVEECEDAEDYEIYSIVRADNVLVIY